MSARDDRRLWEVAAAWHARMLEPKDEAEVSAFEAWLSSDPAHVRAYREMEAISGAVSAVRHRVTDPKANSSWTSWRPVVVAVAILAVLTITALTWRGFSETAYARVSNPGEAVRGVELEDGTKLWLDVGAEVAVRFDDDQRQLTVRKGRVRILPAARGPRLTVAAGIVALREEKNRFDLAIDAEGVFVGALDGPIRVSREGRPPFTLEAGQSVMVDPQGTRRATLDRTWPGARLSFTNTTLARIVGIANRGAGADIVFANPSISALTVTGVLDLRDTRRLARKLAAAHDLQLRDEGQRLVLDRK